MDQAPLVAAGSLATLARQDYAAVACTKVCFFDNAWET